MSNYDPYAPPKSNFAVGQITGFDHDDEYGGIERLPYFLWSLLANALYMIAAFCVGFMFGGDPNAGRFELIQLMIPVFAVFLGIKFWLVALRMINIGYNPWWSAALLVPLVGIFVSLRALMCPSGYAEHKTLDTAGTVIASAVLVLFVLFVVLGVVSTTLG